MSLINNAVTMQEQCNYLCMSVGALGLSFLNSSNIPFKSAIQRENKGFVFLIH